MNVENLGGFFCLNLLEFVVLHSINPVGSGQDHSGIEQLLCNLHLRPLALISENLVVIVLSLISFPSGKI